MKHLSRWILALVALGAVASFSGAWTAVQDPATGKPERIQGKKPGQKGAARAEKQAAIRKALPAMKTSLAEAIALAEKETSGKAWSGAVEVMGDKTSIQVSLFVGEKATVASVDPETRKVQVISNAKKEGEKEGEGETEEGG